MSEEHPLSLVEQVTPIIDLMARTSSHFARLRDFVTLKFPPGFPVKIGKIYFYIVIFIEENCHFRNTPNPITFLLRSFLAQKFLCFMY